MYWDIYCKKLAYVIVEAGQTNLKSVAQDIRRAGWKSVAKAAIHRLMLFHQEILSSTVKAF